MVKTKVKNLYSAHARQGGRWSWILPAVSALTFVASWLGIFPPGLVERWYARRSFPAISTMAEKVADAVSFSWLDVGLPATAILTVSLIRRRKWRALLHVICFLYLMFFWSWGLNYHRQPLISKLQVDTSKTTSNALEKFTIHVADELNRTFGDRQGLRYDEAATQEEATRRVRHVIQVLDGSDWQAPHRIKASFIGNPWFHAAGIDGMFNPLGQEPIVSNTVLDIERPFVMAHELAHVRGYPEEGDANVIAAYATLLSDNPAFRYSGWLTLWLYLRNLELDRLLDTGPRVDLQRILDRAQREQIIWVNDLQRIVLDWFLKANHVAEGVRSYSRIVVLTAGTEPSWERFR